MSSEREFRAIWRQAIEYYLPVGFEESHLVHKLAFLQWRAERRLRIEIEQGEECWETLASPSAYGQPLQQIYNEIERKLLGPSEKSVFDSEAENFTGPGTPAASQPPRRRPITLAVREYLLRESLADDAQLRRALARLELLQGKRRNSARHG